LGLLIGNKHTKHGVYWQLLWAIKEKLTGCQCSFNNPRGARLEIIAPSSQIVDASAEQPADKIVTGEKNQADFTTNKER